jgi:hypothetical protein
MNREQPGRIHVEDLATIEAVRKNVARLVEAMRPRGPFAAWKQRHIVSSRGKWLLTAVDKLMVEMRLEVTDES